MYIYRRTNGEIFTVGYFSPDGRFCAESDHLSKEGASARVHYLNGGVDAEVVGAVVDHVCNILLGINEGLQRLFREVKNG